MKKLLVVLAALIILSFERCKKDNNQGVIQFNVNGIPQSYSGAFGNMVVKDTLVHPNKILQIFSDSGSIPFILLSIGQSSTSYVADSITPGVYPNAATNVNCQHGYNTLCNGFGVLYIDSSVSQFATTGAADTITTLTVTSSSASSRLISGTFSCVLHDKVGQQPNVIITNGKFINVPYTP